MERTGQILLVFVIATSALAMGGIHAPVLAVLLLAAAASVLLLGWKAASTRPRLSATLLFGVACLMVGFAALQAMPLPLGLVRALSPRAGTVWQDAAESLGSEAWTFASLSLDPVATLLVGARGLLVIAVFVAARHMARRGAGALALETAVVGSALLITMIALAHAALGAQSLYGFYVPLNGADRHLAPILNPNHFAAYLTIGMVIALSAALTRERLAARIAAGVAFLALAATELWVGSRGGVFASAVGIAMVIAGTTVIGRRKVRSGTFEAVAVGGIALAGVCMAVLSSSPDAARELAQADLSKLGLFRQAARVVAAFPLTGIGRGAFESVFPAFRTGTGYATFTHPENVALQWLTECGVPVAVVGGGLVAWALRPASLLSRRAPPIGPWAAIVATLLHDLVDFSTELPAVAVALATCAGIAVAGDGRDEPNAADRWSTSPKRTGIVLASAATLAALMALFVSPYALGEDRQRLRTMAQDLSPGPAFRQALAGAIRRHPSEPYFMYVAAVRPGLPLQERLWWAERAVARAAIYPPAHLLMATLTARTDPARARQAYRNAAQQLESGAEIATPEALALVAQYDDARELIPLTEPARSAGLALLIAKLGERLPATAARLESELRALGPESQDLAFRAAGAWRADIEAGESAPWCHDEASTCRAHAQLAADQLLRVAPGECNSYVLSAALYRALGDATHALDVLARASDLTEGREPCLRELARVALLEGQQERADEAVARLARVGCGDADRCAANMLWAHDFEQGRGRPRTAYTYLAHGLERAPLRRDLLVAAARSARDAGLHAEAHRHFVRLVAMEPSDEGWKRSAEAERAAVLGIAQRDP